MKKLKMDKLYKFMINFSFVAAVIAAGSASFWGGHQQKEPDDIQEVLKNMRSKKR